MKFKTTIFRLLFSVFVSIATAQAGTAIITLTDGQDNPVTNTKCVLAYFSAPSAQGLGTSVKWRGSAVTDSAGVINLTNAASGKWQVQPIGPNLATFSFYMPITNGTIRAEDYLTADAGNTMAPDTMSYGVNASDRRYARRGESGGSGSTTNISNATGTNVNASGSFSGSFSGSGNFSGNFSGGGALSSGTTVGPFTFFEDKIYWGEDQIFSGTDGFSTDGGYLLKFAGDGRGLTTDAGKISTLNAPFDGAVLKCSVSGSVTNFFWQ